MRVASIDCGTNSIRLLVADVGADGTLRDVERRMEVVRLGQGVDRTGRLDPAAIERTRLVLVDYVASIRAHGARDIRMVATSASRDADNAEDFRSMVRATLGVDPEIVTGAEEAALSFRGAVSGLPGVEAPVLVADIGGGSTEVVLGGMPGGLPVAALSVDVGCVRLTERHLHDDPATPDQIGAAEADIRVAMAAVRDVVPVARARTFVGVAGSVTTVAAVALDLPSYDPDRIHGVRLPVGRVRAVTAGLLTATRARRAAIPAMHPGRVDVIGAGALVLRVIMDAFELDEVLVSEHDILDGIALSIGDC
ncbi:MAG: Ppx/GppA family phosphatase [Geodermatophilaceae bacterium]|nr:Ppx/GppA family phosphatase [Geodermatophilaceae bacterium]